MPSEDRLGASLNRVCYVETGEFPKVTWGNFFQRRVRLGPALIYLKHFDFACPKIGRYKS